MAHRNSNLYRLSPKSSLNGSPILPGDKSLSHRALIFGALAKGTTSIANLLSGQDVVSTWTCLEKLGVEIGTSKGLVLVHGKGLSGLTAPDQPLDCGNSGTTMRLLMGVLAAQNFDSELIGDSSLTKRPMKRVSEPLSKMGAKFRLSKNHTAPVFIEGTKLQPIDYELKVASAQVKSAILLAALFTEGRTRLSGMIQSRDHTERLLRYFGVEILCREDLITLDGGQSLIAKNVVVPGDISSASFWIAGALLLKNSSLQIHNVSLNPTRMGILRVLKRMTADIQIEVKTSDPEPMGSIVVKSSSLQSTTIEANEVPSLIDEIPLVAVLALFAKGVTQVSGAEELRVKESDRIEAVAKNIRAMGGKIETREDGFVIEGPQKLRGAQIHSYDDHRIAMAFSIAAMAATGESEILNPGCVDISYPDFFKTLEDLSK